MHAFKKRQIILSLRCHGVAVFSPTSFETARTQAISLVFGEFSCQGDQLEEMGSLRNYLRTRKQPMHRMRQQPRLPLLMDDIAVTENGARKCLRLFGLI